MLSSFFNSIFGYNKQSDTLRNHNNNNNNTSDKYKIIDFSENNIHERQPEPEPQPDSEPQSEHIVGPTCQNMFTDIYHDSKQQLPLHTNHSCEKPIEIIGTTVDIEHKADIPDTPESISTLSSDSSFTISELNYDTLPDPPQDHSSQPEDHSSQPKKNTSRNKIPHLNLKIIIPEPYSDHYDNDDNDDNDDDFLFIAPPIQRCSSSEETL